MNSILLYIDPASTSALLYILIALIATIAFALRGFFYKMKNLILGKGFIAVDDFEDTDIVFYSEGKQYWNVFLPVIKALEAKREKCVYLTSDKNDPGLEYQSDIYQSKFIGKLTLASVYLNRLKATFVGMTTPQLDVMMIRRSKRVQHYGHIVHAPTDVFTYRKFAFDYFDSVFCSGYFQMEGIRKLEEQRGTKKKMLLKTGLTYYDVMIDEIKNMPPFEKDRPVVLVAPTWKDYSLLNRLGIGFFEHLLLNSTYDVILRPHPQSYVSFPELIAKIEERFKNEPRFTVDRNPLGTLSMAKSDLMISDLSGVFWDYAFLYSKPVLLLQTDFDTVEGFEGSELNYDMWEVRERPRLGRVFTENEVENISKIVNNLLESAAGMKVEQLRDESVFNFGHAGEAAANQILEIVDNIKNPD